MVVIGAALLAIPATALAHAQLTESAPTNGVNLDASPADVVLVFTEPVKPVSLTLRKADGTVVEDLVASDQRVARLVLPIDPALADGKYLVAYRVMSADTHPIVGAFGFSVGTFDVADSAAPQYLRSSPTSSPVVLAIRLLQFISLLIASGTTFFVVLVRPPTYTTRLLRAIIVSSSAAAALLYLLAIGVGGADIAGAGPTGLMDSSSWRMGLDTSLLASAIVGIVGLVVLIIAWAIRNGFFRGAALLVGGSILVSGLAFTGHAATASPTWLMGPAVALHLVTASFWVAAILPLAWILNRSSLIESTTILNRFSAIAAVGLAILIASGLCISIVQVRSFSAIPSTDYGRILAFKIGLVFLLLAIAAINKFSLTRRIAMGDLVAKRRIQQCIYVEFVAMLGILTLTTLLTNTVPPRASVDVQPQGVGSIAAGTTESPTLFRTTITQQGYVLHISVSLSKAGRRVLDVFITNEDGTVSSPMGVEANMSLPELDIRTIEIGLKKLGVGKYSGELEQITIDGDWELEIDMLVDDFTRLTFDVRIPIGR